MVNFRVTHREADALEAAARAEGRSVGGFIRDRLGLPREAEPDRPTPASMAGGR
jgi:hypothetical protein